MIRVLTVPDVLVLNADELLSRGDVVQASEKYYKAVEEGIKLLARKYELNDILSRVKEKGFWDVKDLDDAVYELSKMLNKKEIIEYWESAILIINTSLYPEDLREEAKKVKEFVSLFDEITNRDVD
ncbi:PaREP1 family protein [Acidianus hospitalis W1]|uniref:PaREP1 family protein n=1 Tax=Acidianus hospitalis (strain W1) TaxID=933801 RepID=F4B646_ACIHW|nr:PaREP1 family protein [Acidianus hospitalis]AEE93334.1 PaREP1 family protein [Acidianus hospitalis W1]